MANAFDEFDAPNSASPAARPNAFDEFDSNAKPEGAFARAGRVLQDPDGGVVPAIGSLLVSAMPESKARGTAGYAKDTGVDLVQGVVGLGESVVGLGDLASFGLVGEGLKKLGYDPKATSQFLAGAYSEDRKEAEKNVDAAKGFTDTLGALAVNPSALLGRIVQSVPGTVGAGAAGGALVRRALPAAVEAAAARGLTGTAAEAFIAQQVAKTAVLGGAAAEGALSAGSIAESGRQAGKGFTDYAGPAVVGGAVTGAIGAASGAIGRKLGIGDVEADLAARSAGVKGAVQTTGGRVAAIGKEGVKEGFLEEAPQSFNEAIATNLATGKPWDTELGKQTAEGLAAGLGMGAGHAALFHPSEKRAIAEKQMAEATDVDQIAAAAQALAGDVREFQDAHAEFRQSVVAEKQQLPPIVAEKQQSEPYVQGDALAAVNQAPALRAAHQAAEAERQANSTEGLARQIEDRINAPLPERTASPQEENTDASQRLAAAALEAPYVAENATPTLPADPVDAELSRRARSTKSNDVAFTADVAAGRISREDVAATLPAPPSNTFPGTSIVKPSAKRGLGTLQAHYQSTGRAAELTEVDPVTLPSAKDATPDANGDLPISREAHGAIIAIAKAFGKKVVLFSSSERVGDGAVLTGDPNTIYLNRSAQKPHLIIVGHEITHQMKMQAPAAYAAFEKVVKEQLGDEGMAAYEKDYAGGDIEEASADLIGNRFQEPEFMQKVFEQVGRDLAPAKALGAVTRMANAIRKVVEGVKATLLRQDNFAVDTMVKDLDKVKEAAHTALVAYAKDRTQNGDTRTQNENVEQGRDEVGRFTALDSPIRNNASGESAASLEAQSRIRDENSKGQTRILVDRDGTVRPLIGPTAVDQKAYPGQVILQKNVGASTWTVLNKGAGVGMSHEGRALDAARRWDRDAKQSPKRPEELLAAVKPRFRAPLAEAFTGLTEQEIGKLQAGTATKLVGLLKQLPGVDETAAIAWSGRAKRGWYKNSSLAMASVFGPDAPRFTALLAALSPQTSVELNLQNALQTWKNWTAAGRPTDAKEIRKIMGRSVQGHKGEKSVLGAWFNNSVSALTVEDPVNTQYSGPKVNSFFQNLIGNTQEVTNDTWMANYALMEQKLFKASDRKINGKKIGDKSWGYLAMSSHVRQAAARLTELTGEEWTPAEVQETVWSWAKALYEAQKDGVSATELLYNEELTDEMVNATPSFATLFTKDTYANILTSAGLGGAVTRLRDEAASGKFETSPKREGQTAPFDSGAQSSFEVAAARRLEKLKEEGRPDRLRDAKESVKRQPLTLEGVHYSQQPRTILSSAYAGMGYAGAERERGATKDRINFYVDLGKGVKPESGVGGYAHKATLSNLYDLGTDPEYLGADAKGNNDFEKRVVDAGYDGYFNPDFNANQGAVVLLGKRSVPVTQAGQGALPPSGADVPRAAREDKGFRATIAKLNGLKSLPSGALTPARWGQVFKMTAPELHGQMVDTGVFEGTDPIYKNELVQRFKDAQPKASEKRATLGDFTSEKLPELLTKEDWTILTAADPAAQKQSDAENAKANAALETDLKKAGYSYTPAIGKYGDVQPGFIITGIAEAEAKALGQKYGQESILTRDGLVYSDGRPNTPTDGTVTVYDTAPEDFYTEVPSTGAFFQVGLKFSEKRSTFYSALQRQLESTSTAAAPAAGWAQQITGLVNKGLVKQDEVTWSGIDEWLTLQSGKVTKKQVTDFLAANGVRVESMVKTDGPTFELDDYIDELSDKYGRKTEDGITYPAWAFDDLTEEEQVRLKGLQDRDGDIPEEQMPQYGSYQLPGGTNYQEVLLTLPKSKREEARTKRFAEIRDAMDDANEAGDHAKWEELFNERRALTFEKLGDNEFQSSHWDGVKNVVAHIRLNDRVDADGAQVLFVEELQSDWAQLGKKKGFFKGADAQEITKARNAVVEMVKRNDLLGFGDVTVAMDTLEEDGPQYFDLEPRDAALVGHWRQLLTGNGGIKKGVPVAPFVQKTDSWVALALKRVIKMAVDGGYSKVAFVNGEQSADRYDLSKQIDSINWMSRGDTYDIVAQKDGNDIIHKQMLTPEALESLVGKEIAKEIIDSPDSTGTIKGEGLKVGGEGMVAFYDKIVPAVLKDVLRKVGGGPVTTVKIENPATKSRIIVEQVIGGWALFDDLTSKFYSGNGVWEEDLGDNTEIFSSKGDATVEVEKLTIAAGKPPGLSQPGFDITPAMAERAKDGMPLFSPKRNIYNAIVKPTWQAPAPSMLDDVLYRIQNKHIDLKRVTEAIGKISDKFDAYLGETLYHGRSAKQVQDFASQELKPLLQELKARNVDLEDFEAFLHNRHAEERNVQVAKINPAMPDGGSGIKTAAARAYLRSLTPLQQRNYTALAARVDRINASTRALLVSSGLETQETVDAWQRTYSKYVPLQRAEMDVGHAGAGTGAGFSTRGSASKRAMGSDRQVVDIIGNLALQRERTITRAEKNRVGNALFGLAVQNPNTEFWLPVNPDAKLDPASQNKLMVELIGMGLNPMDADGIIKEPTQRYVDPKTGLVTERINPALRGRENVIATRVEGRDRFLFLNEKDPRASRMGDAIKNLDAQQLGEILTGLGKVSRWISSVNTQYNPIFGLMNFTRDVQASALNLSTTPLAGKQKEVLSQVMPALRGIYLDVRATRKGQPATSAWSNLWEEFQREGGQTGYKSIYAGSAERTEALHKELKSLSEGKAKAAGRAVLDWLSDYNESIENSTRLAAYKVAKDSGMTNARAAELAKEITVNFNRKGEVATQAGALYAFFNAAVQGTERTVRTLSGPLGKKIIYGGLLLGVLQALALAGAGFDDGDPPDQVKERNFVLPLGDQTYATIPMPLGFNVIPGASRLATEFVLRGFKSPTKMISGFITLATSLNPIGNSSTLGQTLAPTALDPIVALGQNKDNFGRPIAREDYSGLKPTPGFTRKKDTATPWSTGLAEAVNWVTGGTKYTPGMASPTPDQIDYLVGQVGGGVAREVGKVVQTAQSQVTGEALPPYKIPILGRLYGDSKTPAARAARYYQNVQALGEHELELAGRRKDHTGGIAEYIAEHPDAVLVPMAKQIEKRVSELRAKKSKSLEAGDSTKVKLYEEMISAKMEQLNTRVRELQPN